MMRSLLILDDDGIILSELKDIICKIKDIGNFLKIYTASSFESAIDIIKKYKIDIYLLDIDLKQGDLNGVAFAEEVRKKNDHAQIIFLTIFGDNDTRVDVHRKTTYLDYLSKSSEKKELERVIKKAYTYLNRDRAEYIALRQSGLLRHFWCDEILFISKIKNSKSVLLHIYNDGEGIIYPEEVSGYTLQDILGMTNGNFLKQCHRAYLVNPVFIDKSDRGELKIKLKCKEKVEIPIGRKYKDNF